MVTREDYVNLSETVYNGQNVPANWEIQTSFGNTPEGFYVNQDNGFTGAAYKNTITDEVVVVFRGSDDINDWLQNNPNVGLDLLPAQYQNALDLYNQAIGLYGAENVTVSGHSLGGILTQLVCAKTGATGIALNAAGVEHLLDEIGVDPSGNFSNITTYNLANDALNLTNTTLDLNLLGNNYIIPNTGQNPITAHLNFSSLKTSATMSLDEWNQNHLWLNTILSSAGNYFKDMPITQISGFIINLIEDISINKDNMKLIESGQNLTLQAESVPDALKATVVFNDSFNDDINYVLVNSETYTVQPGDDVWSIAQENGLTVQDMINANPWMETQNRISDDQSYVLIKPGETINIDTGRNIQYDVYGEIIINDEVGSHTLKNDDQGNSVIEADHNNLSHILDLAAAASSHKLAA